MEILVQALYYCAINPGVAVTSLTWEGGVVPDRLASSPSMGFSG